MGEEEREQLYLVAFKLWNALAKNQVLYSEEHNRFWFLFETQRRQVILQYGQGPRGGVKECIIILNPAASCLLEKLQHCRGTDAFTDDGMGLLASIRGSMQDEGLSFVDATEFVLNALLLDIMAGKCEFPVLLMTDVGDIGSLPAINAGLPGLGR